MFDKNEEKHIFVQQQQQQNNLVLFRQKNLNIISTSTGFVLLSKLLSQALLSQPFILSALKAEKASLIARPRVKRRSSSLDFVSHNEKNKLLAEFVFSLRRFVVRFEFENEKKYTDEDTEEEDALVRGTMEKK